MATVTEIRGLAERLAKAEALVSNGAVLPVAGLEAYSVVRNGDGTQFYLVRHEPAHEHCTCPDFQQRQQAHGMPCKHILAAQLAAEQAANAQDQPAKRATKAKRAASEHPTVTPEDLAILFGEE